jgi:hypothetical protein
LAAPSVIAVGKEVTPMTEIWLQSNRRVLGMAMVPAALVGVVGLLLATALESTTLRILGSGVAVVGAGLILGLVNQLRRPRIAYCDGKVLFYLRAGAPVAVPMEVVEAFFLGQGPAYLPLSKSGAAESVNLVARLSQKAPEWAHMPVKESLGHWCEGYVTIRGTWCEPLSGEVIRRLNHRLRQLHDAGREGAQLAETTHKGES